MGMVDALSIIFLKKCGLAILFLIKCEEHTMQCDISGQMWES